MYGNYTEYIAYYGDLGLKEADYRRFAIKADRIMDTYTTGIDNVRKLAEAYPDDEYTRESVILCHCEIVNALWQIDEAEQAAEKSRGYDETADGLKGKVIASRSAGNESITYGSGNSTAGTAVEKAIGSMEERKKMIDDIVRMYLTGLEDKNGVNLMYMGAYPGR